MALCSRDKYPPEFRAQIVTEALDEIENGRSLLDYVEERGLTFSSVWGWIAASDPDNFGRVRAMAIGGDALVHKALQLADDVTIDPNHKRIMVETRMRLAGKWNARYGDKVDMNLNIRPAPDWSKLSPSARAEVLALLESQVSGSAAPGAGTGPLIEHQPQNDEN